MLHLIINKPLKLRLAKSKFFIHNMSLLRSFGLCSRPLSLLLSSAKYATHHSKYTEIQDRWREKDGVSKRWNLIYRNPMDNTLNFMTTYLTLSTGAMASCGAYYFLTFDPSDLNKPVLIGDDIIIANNATEGLIYVGAFIALHIAIKLLISKFVIRLYQDGDNYLAIFRKHMYNSITQHQFNLKDFQRLKPPLVVSWGDARFSLGNKHAIILENYFKTPEHFNYLLNKKKANQLE